MVRLRREDRGRKAHGGCADAGEVYQCAARLLQLRAKDVLDWLHEESTSWHMMAGLRGVMSGIITKAIEWEIIPETFANPIRRVKLPKMGGA